MFDQLISHATLRAAFERVRENSGCRGADGVTVQRFAADLDARLDHLQSSLIRGCYRPFPLLRFAIPKPAGGVRYLTVPTVRDRVAQTAADLVTRRAASRRSSRTRATPSGAGAACAPRSPASTPCARRASAGCWTPTSTASSRPSRTPRCSFRWPGWIVVSYDVPDDRRRTRLADRLLDFGVRVQYSVFEAPPGTAATRTDAGAGAAGDRSAARQRADLPLLRGLRGEARDPWTGPDVRGSGDVRTLIAVLRGSLTTGQKSCLTRSMPARFRHFGTGVTGGREVPWNEEVPRGEDEEERAPGGGKRGRKQGLRRKACQRTHSTGLAEGAVPSALICMEGLRRSPATRSGSFPRSPACPLCPDLYGGIATWVVNSPQRAPWRPLCPDLYGGIATLTDPSRRHGERMDSSPLP